MRGKEVDDYQRCGGGVSSSNNDNQSNCRAQAQALHQVQEHVPGQAPGQQQAGAGRAHKYCEEKGEGGAMTCGEDVVVHLNSLWEEVRAAAAKDSGARHLH